MNHLLLLASELIDGTRVRLSDRRSQHAREILRAEPGDVIKVGVRGSKRGTARVVAQTEESMTLEVTLDDEPPERPQIDLILAIPRPKALKRIIPALASLGIDRVLLVNAARVEKSYFDSKVLNDSFLDGLIDLGLEQARDTVAPQIDMRHRFRPFVEDELDTWCKPNSKRLVPHPDAREKAAAVAISQHLTIAIGPDGGWTPFEIELLSNRRFTPISVGPRPLRVEVAVPTVIGALRASW